MKTVKILLVNLFLFAFLMNSFSSELSINKPINKINLNLLQYENGLYYYQNQEYTGLFYNIYSTTGPNETLNDGYSEGELINGKRDGKWAWYHNGVLNHKQEYNNGKLISDIIILNNKERLIQH